MISNLRENRYFVFVDGHYVGFGFVGSEQARRLQHLKGLRLVSANLTPASFPQVPALSGCIHSQCPKCKNEVRNLERIKDDPIGAVWYQVECDECAGPIWRAGAYLDADGVPIRADS
jgi:hypothetical protein